MKIANSSMLLSRENNIDFISNMPNEVLCLIFSPLSLKEKFRTSILSRRYYLVWRDVSTLSFIPREMVPTSQQQSSIECISNHANQTFYNILALHNTDLRKCEIVHSLHDFSLIENWIKDLTQIKHLKELSLTFTLHENPFKVMLILPPIVFHLLDSLQLSKYVITNDLPFYDCKTLRSLKLHEVGISGLTLSSILSYCPSLEYLSLYYCTGLMDINVHSEKLTYLELRRFGVYSIDIHCNNLRDLAIDDVLCIQYISNLPMINIIAPIVEKVQIYPSEVYIESTDACIAYTPMYTSQFNNGKELQSVTEFRFSLTLNNKGGAIALSRVLKDCSRLQLLVVTLQLSNEDEDSDLPYPIETFWDHLSKCDGVENHLRFVHLKDFTGKKLEIGLAKFLISRAKVLRKLVIYRGVGSSRESRQFARGLSSMPTTSPNAILKFEF